MEGRRARVLGDDAADGDLEERVVVGVRPWDVGGDELLRGRPVEARPEGHGVGVADDAEVRRRRAAAGPERAQGAADVLGRRVACLEEDLLLLTLAAHGGDHCVALPADGDSVRRPERPLAIAVEAAVGVEVEMNLEEWPALGRALAAPLAPREGEVELPRAEGRGADKRRLDSLGDAARRLALGRLRLDLLHPVRLVFERDDEALARGREERRDERESGFQRPAPVEGVGEGEVVGLRIVRRGPLDDRAHVREGDHPPPAAEGAARDVADREHRARAELFQGRVGLAGDRALAAEEERAPQPRGERGREEPRTVVVLAAGDDAGRTLPEARREFPRRGVGGTSADGVPLESLRQRRVGREAEGQGLGGLVALEVVGDLARDLARDR